MSVDGAAPSVIRLDLPADPGMWTLARMAVSGIAAQLDFSVEAIEDLRIAVSELCRSCAAGSGGASRILIECSWDEHSIEVRCTATEITAGGDPAGASGRGELDEVQLSRRVLAALADAEEIEDLHDGARSGWFRKGRQPAAS